PEALAEFLQRGSASASGSTHNQKKMHRLLPLWLKKLFLSSFVVLNLTTVLFINLPASMHKECCLWINEHFSQWNTYRIRYASWRWQQYAHLTGLNNRWQMFGYQSRFNWWYDIRAIYSDGDQETSVLLPLPNQSPRTLLERYVFDLKERKFELNIYASEIARERYSRYLMRVYSTHQGLPIQSVRWHLCTQNILPPDQAMAEQRLHVEQADVRLLNQFEVNCQSQNTKLVARSVD
ncbi:MAG: hypothetical protein ABL921_31155, partial [Pirellula sp.]